MPDTLQLALLVRLEAKPGKARDVEIAQALVAQAPELFSQSPEIEPVELLGAKVGG